MPTVLLLLPQFLGVLQQAEIIAGHAFVTHEGKKKALFDAIVQHTRHLNDYPIQNILIALAAIGGVILLVRRIWWPAGGVAAAGVSIVHSSAPFGGPIGAVTGKFSDLFYSDPRRLSAVVTMLLAPMAGIALFTSTLGRAGRAAPADAAASAPASATPSTAVVLRRRAGRPGLALLPAAPVPDRREVRPGDDRRQGPRGVRLPRDPARAPATP